MASSFVNQMPLRWIHLDFHTSADIPDVGVEFDARQFAETLKRAGVEVCTLFGVCHHGMAYYPTKVGKMHPALTFDLLGAQIEACRSAGIKTPVYITWPSLCMNSPYIETVEAHAREIMTLYNPDGIFFDIVWQHQPGCYCRYCMESMERLGLDPECEQDVLRHSDIIVENTLRRLSKAVWDINPEASIFYNGRVGQGLGRWIPYMSHIEIEALPTGGWGYSYFPFWVRYARNFGKPTQGMTGRFHTGWADFGGLKDAQALHFECAGILANASAISIGDQLHPRGKLDEAVYETIGEAFAEVAKKQPWCQQAQAVTEIAVIISGKSGDAHQGACKALMELHQQFDILEPVHDLDGYEVVIIPDEGEPAAELVEKLTQFLDRGGKLLLSHQALLDPRTGNFALAEQMGCRYVGPSPFCPDYFRPGEKIRQGIREFNWALYDESTQVQVTDGEVLGEVWDPYFNRTWRHFTSHRYAPAAKRAERPMGVQKGNVIYLYGPFFGAYWRYGNAVYRRVIENCLNLLLPHPLVRTSAPRSAEVTVTRKGNMDIVHVVNYTPQRQGDHVPIIEQTVPLREVEVSLRLDGPPSRCYLAPAEQELECEYADGYASCLVPRVDAHAMVVFER